jgi:glucans biosynthesis protein
VYRRQLIATAAATTLLAPVARAAKTVPEPKPGPFDGSTVRMLAHAVAQHPFEKPSTTLPAPIAHLDFDAYRGIRYRKDRALWAGQNLRFTAEFLPRGFLFPERVDMFVVADGKADYVPYDPDIFDYADPKLKVADNLGYSGVRLHTPLNRPDYFDEVCVFQGASYFRAVAKGQTYGLSARGLAIGTGSPKGEEFARFRAFWLERPQPGADAIVVHALLDTPSAAGAYRFTIRPGQTTIFDVESVLYPRTDITEPGIAPLTGMFDFDANNHNRFDDWRPAAHDSDGISFWTGGGEQIWRALNNPVDLQFTAFTDTNPRGFGMMQRKRAFADYRDLALNYQSRPSLFIEPVGAWNEGFVDLIELPSPNEVNDNMVAFWRPKDKLSAGGEFAFTYRMHWGWDCPLPTDLGRAVDTRIGAGPDPHSRQIVIDFAGNAVKSLQADSLKVDIGASKGSIRNVVSEPNPDIGGWRLIFDLEPGGERLIDLHARILDQSGKPLSETWIYRWTP